MTQNEKQKRSRFVAKIKALSEKEQAAFWRGVMAIVDAGCRTGTPPAEMAKYWSAFFSSMEKNT